MVVIPSTLSDHPSLVGIVRLPTCTYESQEVAVPLILKDENNDFYNVRQIVDMASNINGAVKTSGAFNIPKGAITDFYPYTYYVLTDNETEPLLMQPQYLPSTLYIKGKFAISHQPIERYYPSSYKGDTSGNVYNITNVEQMMLPTATNEGLNYLQANANSIAQTRKNQITGNVLNAVNVVGSAIATAGMSLIGGGVSSVIDGINSIKETDARNKDMVLTPSSISSFGTPSTRNSFGTNSVRLLKYTVKDNIKAKAISFAARYGSKYNNYATINIRSYKGYIKYINPDVDSNIDNYYLNKIINILERGVYCE